MGGAYDYTIQPEANISKAKWWIGFLLCISIPKRFYVHNFILIIVFVAPTIGGWHSLLFFLSTIDKTPIFLQSARDQPCTTLARFCLFTILMYCGRILECYPNCKTTDFFAMATATSYCYCCFLENSMQVFVCCGSLFSSCKTYSVV